MRHWSFLDDLSAEDWTPQERAECVRLVLVVVLVVLALGLLFGPLDAPSPNRIGLR